MHFALWTPAEQREVSGRSQRNRPRAIERFFHYEGHKAIHLVLQLRSKYIALHASPTFTADVTSQHLIVTIVQIHHPTGISACRISIGPAGERKSQVQESALRTRWKRSGQDRNAPTVSKHQRR